MLAMMPNHTMKERVYTEISNYDACFYKFKGVANNISDLLKVVEGNVVMDTFISALDFSAKQFFFGDEKKGVEEILMKSIAQKEHGEVFTPEFLVNEILDEFEKRYPDFFASTTNTVLDFAAGCGNLLKGVIQRFYNKTRHLYNDDDECVRHILKNQIYAIEFQANNYQLLCDNLDPHKLVPNNPHFVCANAIGFDYWDMMYNFDMTFINPPYSISNGNGDGKKYDEKYQIFSELAHNISKRFVLNIIPAKFLYSKNEFRTNFFENMNVVCMKNYLDPSVCFSGANVAGGVLWYILDKKCCNNGIIMNYEVDYYNNMFSGERDVFKYGNDYPRFLISYNIIDKLKEKCSKFFNSVVCSTNIFNINTNYTSSLTEEDDNTYKVYCKGDTVQYIEKDKVIKNVDIIDDYKCIFRCADGDAVYQKKLNAVKVTNFNRLIEPNELFSGTFLCVYHSKNKTEVENVCEYFHTKFARFMLLCGMTNQHLSKERFCFIPVLDFSKSWNDKELYEYFNLTDEEISFIEYTV